MNFNKIKSSEKFDYMFLSRLLQDAKYFIQYPNLKHLWAKTLDEHIKQMKDAFNKCNPKPEWTSLEEIENLAQQMKEAYKNHWNEVHPDNKIKSSKQPTTPKPTEVLPTNMQWAWDPKANTWIAVMKDNPVVTPPTYNPNNIQNQNTTSYMSTVKSELKDNGNISDYLALDDGTGTIILVNDKNENFEILLKHRDLDNKVIIKELINKDDLFNGIDKIDFTKKYNTFKSDLDKVNISIDDLKHYSDQVNKDLKEALLNKKQSSCLEKFLDNPQYSKEIKIEAGLIKEGLVKYAGFDFNKGTKYVITDKGLKFLKAYKEQELNEAQNEREKLAYLFGFNTDEVSTLDTTGKIIKSEEITDEQLEESWNKYYPLYRKDIEEEKMTEENYPADDEVAQKLKTTLSMYLYGLKRYRKAIPIMKYHTNAKMKRAVEDGHSKGLSEDEITKQVDAIAEEYYKKENKIKPTFNSLSEDYLKSFLFGIIKNKKSASLNKFAKQWTICEADGTELGEVEADSELDAKVKFGIKHPEYAESLSISAKCVNAQYEQTTEQHLDYPNPSETPHDDVIIENHDGWVNTAGLKNKSVYRKLFILAKMLEDYHKKELIWPAESEDDNIEIITGDAKAINELEHKIKDLGFYCESVLQSELSETGLIYSLKIFLDEE